MTNLPQNTAYLTKSENPPLPQQTPVTPVTPQPCPQPWRIILYIGNDTLTSMGVEVGSMLTIGRADLTENHVPGIDLGPFRAQDRGVSRRHAILFPTEDALYVRDLESTNGTVLNGFRLQPKVPYKVRNGDRLELGQLQLVVRIVHAPTK
jgi:pSer/pThr/pTyr-binding forkhead associated (FHA) protein